MTTGENMRKARQRAGLTVPQLSEISAVSVAAIYNAETDRFSSTLHTVMSLADALNISIDEYIGRKV